MSPSLAAAFAKLHASMRLLDESLTSFSVHGIRSADKVLADCSMVVNACLGVVAEIGRVK